VAVDGAEDGDPGQGKPAANSIRAYRRRLRAAAGFSAAKLPDAILSMQSLTVAESVVAIGLGLLRILQLQRHMRRRRDDPRAAVGIGLLRLDQRFQVQKEFFGQHG